MTLTDSEIQEIEDILHEEIQFHDEHGCHANQTVLDEVTEVLTRKFGPRKSNGASVLEKALAKK